MALCCSACDKSATTTTPTTTTPAAPAYTETFAGTLPVGGFKFYSFSIATQGTINAILAEISGADIEPSVIVNLGIGTPAGVTCAGTSTRVQVTGDAGISTSVTAVQTPGTYCVSIADTGNLPAPATFRVAIEHP